MKQFYKLLHYGSIISTYGSLLCIGILSGVFIMQRAYDESLLSLHSAQQYQVVSKTEQLTEQSYVTQAKKSMRFTTSSKKPDNVMELSEATKVLNAYQNASRSIAYNVVPSVVAIDVREEVTRSQMKIDPFLFFFGIPEEKQAYPEQKRYQEGFGSGIIVQQKKDTVYVLTNSHVVDKADTITIRLSSGEEFSGNLIGIDERRDLALVSFTTKLTMIVAKLGDSAHVQPGDIVYAIGSPLGFQSTVTQGIISAVGRTAKGNNKIAQYTDYIQTDAAINPGNSGGALIDINGNVIGINTWIASQTGADIGLAFAVPVNNAKKVIQQLIQNGKISDSWLGVTPYDITDTMRLALNLSKKQRGAIIYNIVINSPAMKGGLRPGDIITAIDNKQIIDEFQLRQYILTLVAHKTYIFSIIRNNKPLQLSITIAVRNEADTTVDVRPGIIPFVVTKKEVQTLIQKKYNRLVPLNTVLIEAVVPNSTAESAGLQIFDQIISINNQTITSIIDFYNILSKTDIMQFKITVERNNRRFTIILDS